MATKYNSLSVLIADDFSNFRSTVNSMLLGLGVHTIDMASNGEEVIECCSRNRYDIILSDYNLGEGRNGQHVLEELRFRNMINWYNIFIMVSAESSRNIVMSAYDCEPNDYLMKPITTRMLEKRVDRLLKLREKLAPVHEILDRGDEQHAVDKLIDMSLEENRYSTYAQKMLGELFLKRGEFNKAEKLYTKTLEVRQLEWARLGLAKVKQKVGELETAGKWLNRIVEDNPLFLPAYDVLADNWEQMGNKEESQRAVEQAVNVSPMSILRQKRLASIAIENGDTSTALEALRKTVKLGRLSCHGSAKDSLDFARIVVGAIISGKDLPGSIFSEALEILDSAIKHFELSDSDSEDIVEISERVKAAENGDLYTTTEFRAIREEDLLEEAAIDEDLETVKNLIAEGRDKEVSWLLEKLKTKFEDDELSLKKLDKYLDEPVSETNRELVAEINREGISLYSSGRFEDSLDCFESAKKLFPKHVGIQLNIAQCLIGKLKLQVDDEIVFNECMDALNIVENSINSENSQYDRYLKLKQLATSIYKRPFMLPGEKS